MSLERVMKAIMELGLSKIDAQVYIYLALNGLLEADSIIEGLDSCKKRIFGSLDALMEKGLVFASEDVPKMFSTLPFEKLLVLLVDVKKEQVQAIQTAKGDLLSSWKKVTKIDE